MGKNVEISTKEPTRKSLTRLLRQQNQTFTLATQNCASAVTSFYVKTHSDKKHERKQTFNFGQNAGQRGECVQLGSS